MVLDQNSLFGLYILMMLKFKVVAETFTTVTRQESKLCSFTYKGSINVYNNFYRQQNVHFVTLRFNERIF